MSVQRQEIKSLIVACERIHAFLAEGHQYTDDEQAVMDFCVSELQSRLREIRRTGDRPAEDPSPDSTLRASVSRGWHTP